MQRVISICRRISSQVWGNITAQPISSNMFQFTGASNIACFQRLKHSSTNETVNEEKQTTSQFSGNIPVDQLEFSYSRSSGAGGQHVNKVNTKVELRFHVPSASWLAEDVKSKLMEMEHNRITKDGYLVLTSERTRKQMLNQADVMDKLRTMVFQAALKPRGLTEEEIQKRDKRLGKAKEQALREKRHHSLKKHSRGSL